MNTYIPEKFYKYHTNLFFLSMAVRFYIYIYIKFWLFSPDVFPYSLHSKLYFLKARHRSMVMNHNPYTNILFSYLFYFVLCRFETIADHLRCSYSIVYLVYFKSTMLEINVLILCLFPKFKAM